jgi:hypothetical protein
MPSWTPAPLRVTGKANLHVVHNSWALLRVAAQFLKEPVNDIADLGEKVGIPQTVADSLVPRMVAEGWLDTDDGWVFSVTPAGRLALEKKLRQTGHLGRKASR